jgi:hypothetical protein
LYGLELKNEVRKKEGKLILAVQTHMIDCMQIRKAVYSFKVGKFFISINILLIIETKTFPIVA